MWVQLQLYLPWPTPGPGSVLSTVRWGRGVVAGEIEGGRVLRLLAELRQATLPSGAPLQLRGVDAPARAGTRLHMRWEALREWGGRTKRRMALRSVSVYRQTIT